MQGICIRLYGRASSFRCIVEVAKEYLTATNYGKRKFTSSSEWEVELGDLLFSVLCVANATNVDLTKAVTKALKKYEKRLRNKRSAASR